MDLIEGTAGAWVEALKSGRVWDDPQDRERVRAAFTKLASVRVSWPSPADFLAALPPRRTMTGPPRLESDAARQAGMKACHEILRKLNVGPRP